MTRNFLSISWKDVLKLKKKNSFAVFNFLSSNLIYFSLFELFIATNVTSRCIMSSRLPLLYLAIYVIGHVKTDTRVTFNATVHITYFRLFYLPTTAII